MCFFFDFDIDFGENAYSTLGEIDLVKEFLTGGSSVKDEGFKEV